MFFVSKGIPFWFLFYSAVAGVVPCGGRKSLPVYHHSAGYILFPLGSLSSSVFFENRIPLKLKPALRGVCRLAKYSVAYEGTQSNRASDFRDFVCSLFPKAILFDLYKNSFLTILTLSSKCYRCCQTCHSFETAKGK